MLITTCTLCLARFRVTPIQLNAKQGQVRFGLLLGSCKVYPEWIHGIDSAYQERCYNITGFPLSARSTQ